MSKFGRSYRLTIDLNDGGAPIVITMPLTVQFTIQRNTMASLNYMNIDVYNLSEATRARIFQDRYTKRLKTVTFEAGYNSLVTVFKGYIFESNSTRDGNNIITNITSRDGGFDVSTSMTFQTFDKGKTIKEIMQFLTGQFQNLEFGAIGGFDEKLNRPVTLNGNTYDLLKKYSGNQVFIDLNKVYILKNNEVLAGQVPVIDASTGLLATPQRDDAFLEVTTLFEPRIGMGQEVNLQSVILPVYNGTYKVLGVLHQGIISEAVNGACRSTFNLWTGSQTFGEFSKNG